MAGEEGPGFEPRGLSSKSRCVPILKDCHRLQGVWMEEAQGGCISHRMRGYPRTPERSFPRSTKKGKEKSGSTQSGAREAGTTQDRAREQQRRGHLKARCRQRLRQRAQGRFRAELLGMPTRQGQRAEWLCCHLLHPLSAGTGPVKPSSPRDPVPAPTPVPPNCPTVSEKSKTVAVNTWALESS